MQLKTYFPLVLITLLLNGCNQGDADHSIDTHFNEKAIQINKVLAQAKKEYGLSAIIYSIREGDHALMSGALGYSTNFIPATTTMHYRAGGVTEMMLTTILLKLIEENNYGITLDDPIAKWFPTFPRSEQVTLRMLGNSTSGYFDFLHSPQILNDKALYTKNWDPMTLINIGVSEEILFDPGTRFGYSHTNFCILGVILEKITNKNLHQLVDEYISRPLNLKNTQYTISAELPSPALHSYVTINGVFHDAKNWTPTWAGPSGLVISNIIDLTKWMHALGTGALLSADSYQELIKTGPSTNPSLQFALGFIVSNSWYYQNPSINGYKTVAAYFKPKNLSVVITVTDGVKSNPDTHYAKLIFPKIAQVLAPEYPLVAVPN